MASDKIKQLCEYMDKNMIKNYPIPNTPLTEMTDYIKNSYLKMLAVILRQAANVQLSQQKLFERIVAGVNTENSVQDYLRQALEIEVSEFEDFITQFKEMDLKYRFVLDALLLSAVENMDENQVRLIAGFMESLALNKEEVTYLTALAKSILEQDSVVYAKAEYSRPEYIQYQWFGDYTELFVVGVLGCSKEELYIRSKKQNVCDLKIF